MGDAVQMSAAQARSVALAAQNFGRAWDPGASQLHRAAIALGAIQIDAVNVLTRSHYLSFYSRLGRYDTGVLDGLAYRQSYAATGAARQAHASEPTGQRTGQRTGVVVRSSLPPRAG